MRKYALFSSHASAYRYVKGGRSKIHRPLYTRYASIKAVEPDNPQTDLTINWRSRHIAKEVEYRETLLRRDTESPGWSNKYPIAIIKSDNTITLTGDFRRNYSTRQIWWKLIGPNLLDISLRNGKVKVHQSIDPVRKTRVQKCRKCRGELSAVATCWEKHGVIEEELFGMESECGWNIYVDDLNDPHSTHIVRLKCYKCKGTGLAGNHLTRLDSYVWDSHLDLVFDIPTGVLLRKEEGHVHSV